MALYGKIGASYSVTRRPDPRIAARIEAAVGSGGVLSVGGGTGSYEPPGTVRFPRARFDVALAVLTLHRWSDLGLGLAELQRVARRVVILTWDAAHVDRFWLLRDYFPETSAGERARMPGVERVAAQLGARVEVVPISHDCADGFLCSFWRRPAAHLDPVVRAGISYFAQLGDATDDGIARLGGDLRSGAWERRSRELRDLDELDVGYRLLTAS